MSDRAGAERYVKGVFLMPTLEAVRLPQTEISPVDEDYRHKPIEEGFDFEKIIDDTEKIRGNLAGKALYLVVFRSKLKPGADKSKVALLDAAAHEEALTSDEFYAYFQGERNEDDEALSMCLWGDARAAFEAVHGAGAQSHREAAASADELYGDNYQIEFFSILKTLEGLVFIRHQHPQINKEEN
jgi:hypothetical protein